MQHEALESQPLPWLSAPSRDAQPLLLGFALGSPLLPSPSILPMVPLFIPPPSKSACLKGVIKHLHLGKGELRHRRTIPKETSCRGAQHPHAMTRPPIPFPTREARSHLNQHPEGWPGSGGGGWVCVETPFPAWILGTRDPQLSLAWLWFPGSRCPAAAVPLPAATFLD